MRRSWYVIQCTITVTALTTFIFPLKERTAEHNGFEHVDDTCVVDWRHMLSDGLYIYIKYFLLFILEYLFLKVLKIILSNVAVLQKSI